MGEKNMGKTLRLHCSQTNTIATRRNVISDFRMHFCYVIVHPKTTLLTEFQKKVETRRVLTKLTASLFRRI